MANNKDLQTRKEKAVPNGVGVLCGFYADKAKNAELFDVEGKRYIDFAGGIGVLNTGHLHPKVQAAVREQLEKFSHTCFSVVPYELYVALAERINKIAPGSTPKKTAFFSAGAEAVENAVKIARHFTGRPAVIAFNASFHGRTNLTMALTGKVTPYKNGFGPFPADIHHAPFPNPLHGISVSDALEGLQSIFRCVVEPNKVAAIIIEPVQGEGGFYPAPQEFLQALRAICDEHAIVLIFDEVQSGFARTGKLFATEHYGIEPDLMTIAKSMAGGFPLSAVVGKAQIMDGPHPGGLGGTYPGSPLSLAAAHAVLDVIQEEGLCERAEKLGAKLRAKLESLRGDIPQIRDIRGLGAMLAVEFMKPGGNEPDGAFAKAVQQHALADGLILLLCGSFANAVRFLFPLTIQDTVFDEALAKLETSIKRAAG